MPSEQAQEAFDAALNAHDGGDVALAEAKYREALAADPAMTVAHNNLGMVLIQEERLEEAVGSLQQAVLQDPQYAEAYNNLGFAFRRLGRDVEAAAQYEKFLALTPDVEEASKIREWIDRVRAEADAAAEAEMPPPEAAAPESPVEPDPAPAAPEAAEFSAPGAEQNFAAAAPGGAEADAEAASPYGTDMTPGDIAAPGAIDPPPADQEFSEFFESDGVGAPPAAAPEAAPVPGFEDQPPPQVGGEDDGLSDKAEAEFEEMFGDSGLVGGGDDAAAASTGSEEDDEEIGHLYTEAMTKFQDGDMGESARFCSLIMEKSPQHFPTLLLAGRVALSRQDHTRATALLQKALEVRADDPEAYYFLGQCYEKRGLLDEAQEVYKKCVEVSPEGPRAKRLAKWLQKQRADSTVGQGEVRCELCLRTVPEGEVSPHEGRRVCKNCLETLGAKEEIAAQPRDEGKSDRAGSKEERRVVVPRKRSSPMLVVLLLLVLLGAGGYVGAVYMDFVKGPKALEDLLGKKPAPVKPVVNKRPVNNRVPPKKRKISPAALQLATVEVGELQPMEALSVDLGAKVKATWMANRTEAPPNAEEMRFALVSGPPDMVVDPVSGMLTWTPGLGEEPEKALGEHKVLAKVTCGDKQAASGFTVAVKYGMKTPREVDVQLRAAYRSDPAHLGLVFADFDGDGQPDLAAGCGNALGGQLRMMLSAGGSSEFSKAPVWTLEAGPVGLASADLDGDGRSDLGWASWIGGRLHVLRGMARRAPLKPVRVADTRSTVEAMATVDLDGDGRVDMVVANGSLGKLSAHKGRGGKLAETALVAGGLLPPRLFALKSAKGRGDRVGVAISGGSAAGRLLVYSLRGGKLVRDQALELPKGIIKSVRGGDFDGDGKADAALLYGGNQGALRVLSGADPKKMSLLEPVSVGPLPIGMEAGEINGDGRTDLVLAGPETVKVLLSTGRGRFVKVASARILGLAPPVALWPSREGKPAKAAVLNLKGRAWVLTMPAPLKKKPKLPVSDATKGGG